MSLKPGMPDFFKTIAFRLTIWYAGIFSISSCVAFGLFYYIAAQTLQDQVDRDLLDKAAYFSKVIQRNGLVGAGNLAVIEAQASGEKMIFFRLLYPSGEVFASSHMSYWKKVPVNLASIKGLLEKQTPVFETLERRPENSDKLFSDQKARVLYALAAKNIILQTGIAMDFESRFLSAFRMVFLVAMGFIILFSAVSGWFLVRKAMAGVDRIRKTAQSITGSNLEERVRITGNQDELDQLASTFNRMLDRISDLVGSIREMSDNIAHDLKSPLTRIRGFAELSLVQNSSVREYETMAANTIEESDRLLDMINTMLVISRAEAGEAEFEFSEVDLTGMITGICELFIPVAEDKDIELTFDVEENLKVLADSRMLQRAFSNLVDNALKYTPAGGKVQVRVRNRKDGMTAIDVSDTGPGIDPVHFEKIFERFFRAESSRTSQGTGLGLSLARTIAKQHAGDIIVDSTPGKGSVFTLTLPASITAL